MVVDIGTGSGSAVLRRAAREPQTLFIALDADASAMADASRRAARPPSRGGRSNVMFLVAAAESLPDALCAIADEATVILPWGSLFDAVLQPSTAPFQGIAAVLKGDGLLTILVSAHGRDQLGTQLDARAATVLAHAYTDAGFRVVECRAATGADVQRLSSGWGRRLGIPERRLAWLFALRLAQRSVDL